MSKRKSQRNNTQPSASQSHSSSEAPSVLHSFMALVCLDPGSSSEDSSPSHLVSNNKRGIFANMRTHYFSEPLSAKAEHEISEKEYAARQVVETTFRHERMQIEELFCTASDKINMADAAARQLFFIATMGMVEAEARARDKILTEFTAAEFERTDIEDMFKDGLVIENLGGDFQSVSSPTASQSRLFQPAAAPAPAAKSLTDWLLGR